MQKTVETWRKVIFNNIEHIALEYTRKKLKTKHWIILYGCITDLISTLLVDHWNRILVFRPTANKGAGIWFASATNKKTTFYKRPLSFSAEVSNMCVLACLRNSNRNSPVDSPPKLSLVIPGPRNLSFV